MKKTIAIISIAVLALIVAATVILAVIQKSFYNPIPTIEDIAFIRVYKGDGTCQEFYNNSQDVEDKKVFDKIIDLHEESLKENILSSMFQGALSFDGGIVTQAITGDTFNANLVESTYIEICYSQNNEQLLKYNGKTFTDGDGDTGSKTACDSQDTCIFRKLNRIFFGQDGFFITSSPNLNNISKERTSLTTQNKTGNLLSLLLFLKSYSFLSLFLS